MKKFFYQIGLSTMVHRPGTAPGIIVYKTIAKTILTFGAYDGLPYHLSPLAGLPKLRLVLV